MTKESEIVNVFPSNFARCLLKSERLKEKNLKALHRIVWFYNGIWVWLLLLTFHVRLFFTIYVYLKKKKKRSNEWKEACMNGTFYSCSDTILCAIARTALISLAASVSHCKNKWWEPKWTDEKEREHYYW